MKPPAPPLPARASPQDCSAPHHPHPPPQTAPSNPPDQNQTPHAPAACSNSPTPLHTGYLATPTPPSLPYRHPAAIPMRCADTKPKPCSADAATPPCAPQSPHLSSAPAPESSPPAFPD